MKVLHVAESFGGGVATAMAEYVRSTPEIEHYLLFGDRLQVTADSYAPYVWSRPLGTRMDALRTIRATVAELQPDVVHAQSSFAGAYVRLALSNRKVRIVYTPHCFAFARRDISKRAQRGYWLLEKLLARNTEVVAGCSPYEAQVAAGWRGDEHAVYVPNIARVDAVQASEQPRGPLPRVAGLGRLDIQKDPEWFAAVARQLTGQAEVIWIGGGSEKAEAAMRASGVTVTGWIGREVAMGLLASADCFIVSSLWEGFPMAVLEAHALGVPTILRHLDAIPDSPAVVTTTQQEETVELARAILSDPARRTENLETWTEYLQPNTPEVQRERLLQAYGFTPKA